MWNWFDETHNLASATTSLGCQKPIPLLQRSLQERLELISRKLSCDCDRSVVLFSSSVNVSYKWFPRLGSRLLRSLRNEEFHAI